MLHKRLRFVQSVVHVLLLSSSEVGCRFQQGISKLKLPHWREHLAVGATEVVELLVS